MAETHPKKIWDGDVYHCVTSPFLLITRFNHLGVEDTNCWCLASGIFCLIQDSHSTVCGHHCMILLFMMGVGSDTH